MNLFCHALINLSNPPSQILHLVRLVARRDIPMGTRSVLWHGSHDDPPVLGLAYFLEFGEVRPRLQGEALDGSIEYICDPQFTPAEPAAAPAKKGGMFSGMRRKVEKAANGVKKAVQGKPDPVLFSAFVPTGTKLLDGEKVTFSESKSEKDGDSEVMYYKVQSSDFWVKGSESLQVKCELYAFARCCPTT